jgi:hypothetical protein
MGQLQIQSKNLQSDGEFSGDPDPLRCTFWYHTSSIPVQLNKGIITKLSLWTIEYKEITDEHGYVVLPDQSNDSKEKHTSTTAFAMPTKLLHVKQ